MNSMKLGVLDELKDMLDGRIAGRLKAKPVAAKVDIISAKPEGSDNELSNGDPQKDLHEVSGEPQDESPAEEKGEGLESELAEDGCDIKKLTPEEQDQLKMLYEKMQG